ncbi:MAG: AMMECR1 domain-containing protein, partial [Gammaproteobacteria bacterium]|nr:AMMECR1 domain-containing protein [Gammaproteobacteria bacterium]
QLSQTLSLPVDNKTLPKEHLALKQYNALCFVSIYSEHALLSCFLGQGDNIISAMNNAMQYTLKETKPHSLEKLKIELCFLFNERLAESIRLGIHALSISQENKIAFFKNSVPIHHNFNLEKTVEKLSEKAGLAKNAYSEKKAQLKVYDALEFIEDKEYQLCDLYRGNQLILQSDVSTATLKNSLKMAAEFLERSILPSGKIIHLVYPVNGETKSEETLSAVTRNIASLWQLQESHPCSAVKKALLDIVSMHFVETSETHFPNLKMHQAFVETSIDLSRLEVWETR